MSLRALVVGLGKIGMTYDLSHNPDEFVMTHTRAFQVHSGFELVGGVDLDSQQISLFEEEYGCRGYNDLVVALRELNPDVIAIATPTELHYQTIVTIIEVSHPKVIICEKPLAYDYNQAVKMAELCQAANIEVFVNYMRRVDPGVIEIKKRFVLDLIAKPVKGVCWYSKGLLNNGSHFINLLQYWLGAVENFEVIDKGRTWNEIDPEPDFKVVFEHGSVVFLAAKEEYYSHYAIELISASGRLNYAAGGSKILWQSIIDDPLCAGYQILNPVSEYIKSELDTIQLHLLDNLISSLNGKQSSICTIEEAIDTLKILDKIGNKL